MRAIIRAALSAVLLAALPHASLAQGGDNGVARDQTVPAKAADAVEFNSIPFPGLNPELEIRAQVIKPKNQGPGPFPAIIVLHGCSGPHAQFVEWGRKLASWGYIALLPDSFSPRGPSDICTNTPSVPPAVRIWDVFGAARYLNEQPDVQAKNIGVIGFSHGGWTIMRMIQENVFASGYGIKGAVAYYPLCDKSRDGDNAIPLLVLIGEKDTATPAARCREMDEVWKRPELAEVVTYPNAYHSFDGAARPHTIRGVVVGGKVESYTLARDPEAAADAETRTRAFFEALLK